MALPTLHIVFNLSAAADLREALARMGRADQVLGLSDDLSFGPIDPPDPGRRAQWVETELEFEGWDEVGEEADAFWAQVLSFKGPRNAWMSRRSTQDYAGFLELVWRLGDSRCKLVDLTEVIDAPTLALVPARRIVEDKLVDRATALTGEMRAAYRGVWRTLRDENAALRVLRPDLELVSAPITFFDEQLLSYARRDSWMKLGRVVGQLLDSFGERRQSGDIVPLSRIGRLVDLGLLQVKGGFSRVVGIADREVRLPPLH